MSETMNRYAVHATGTKSTGYTHMMFHADSLAEVKRRLKSWQSDLFGAHSLSASVYQTTGGNSHPVMKVTTGARGGLRMTARLALISHTL